MPTENLLASAQPFPPIDPVSNSDEPRRIQRLRWVTAIGVLATVAIIVLYTLLYALMGVWQLLGVAGLAMLGLLCVVLAGGLTRRGRLDAAGYVLLFTVGLAYGGGEWLLIGGTFYLLVGGILLIFLVGSLVLPRHGLSWLLATGLFTIFIWAANVWGPRLWPRYDVSQFWLFNLMTPGTTVVVALAMLWRLIRAFRIGTIRLRLLIAFVLMALLPALLVGGVATAGGAWTGRERVERQLESVAILKAAQIQTWIRDLQDDLDTIQAEQPADVFAQVLEPQPADPTARQVAYDHLLDGLRRVIARTQKFEVLFLVNAQGQVILSTDAAQVGQNDSGAPYFQAGLKGNFITSPFYSTVLRRSMVIVAQPVVVQGQAVGVLAGRANLDRLNAIMEERSGLGDTGETYLVGKDNALLTATRAGLEAIYVRSFGVNQAIRSQSGGLAYYENYPGEAVVGAYRWLPELQAVLVAEQTRAEAFGVIYLVAALNLLVLLGAGVLAALAGLLLARSIGNPLTELAQTATRIAAGDLTQIARVTRQDETGALAQAFNSMTRQLQTLIGSLEQRVAARTRELAQRSAYLEASAEVGRAISSILDPEQLIHRTVDLIRERFGLYYVGLFLVDDLGEWAVLRATSEAGTGEAGRAMLARGHRIKVGEGMVGWCVAHGQARIAEQAEADAVRLAVTELPDTHAEAALPLRSRDRVLGALTVQSTQPHAFDPDTVVVLQILADLVAVALDNARLFARSQEAMQAERRAYGEISREAWAAMIRTRPEWGYRSTAQGVAPSRGDWRPEMRQAVADAVPIWANDGSGSAVAVPIRVRGRAVGALHFRKAGATWTAAELPLLETLADQLGQALESARLYQDTQRRATYEQILGEVATRIRESLDMDTVLQTAIRQIGESLDMAEVEVRMVGDEAASE